MGARSVVVGLSVVLAGTPALATFHLWEISEIYSNANGTVQFIELFTTFNSQQFTTGTTIRASQGASSNDFVFPGNTPSPTAGHHLLLATADFASLPGAVTPDFTLADGFLFGPDGIVNYIGANSLTYGCLPIDGVLSLHCDANNGISCTASSIGVNSPRNYAGATGSIDASGGGCADGDGDGFGSPGNAACPGGAAEDCDDCDGTVFPGAFETVCDAIDNDCDPSTEDDPDDDNDGVGVCTDCDDADPNRFPGNPEVLCNGIDDDCDPSTDDDINADGDPVSVCGGDCDDGNAAVFPGNVETTCNGVDDDCDPSTLDDTNADGDPVSVCEGDCDDGNSAVFPGNVETTCNGVDDDCDPTTEDDPNADGDPVSVCEGDCDDGNSAVFPGNVETTCNGLDDDCDPGTPDDPDNDCPSSPPVAATPPHDEQKNRYISFDPNNGAMPVAFEVTLSDLRTCWVGEPCLRSDTNDVDPQWLAECVQSAAGDGSDMVRDWSSYTDPATGNPVVHVRGCVVLPNETYDVRAIAVSEVSSAALTIGTVPDPEVGSWADIVGEFIGGSWTGPNSNTNFRDVAAGIQGFQQLPTAAPVSWVDLVDSGGDEEPNYKINFNDIGAIIRGFLNVPYPGTVAACAIPAIASDCP